MVVLSLLGAPAQGDVVYHYFYEETSNRLIRVEKGSNAVESMLYLYDDSGRLEETVHGHVDHDEDGLTTRDEAVVFENEGLEWRATPDSDGDGFTDGYQHAPSGYTANPSDLDGDGLTNAFETGQGLDPGRADSDGDGVADGVEVAEGTDAGFNPALRIVPLAPVLMQ